MLDDALSYARRGWAVFPCRPGTKFPMTENGLLDATCDEAKIRRWWTDQPKANIAVATGKISGFWALDPDRHGDRDGVRSLAELEEKHGALPWTVVQFTPGGGHHRFFGCGPVEVRNSASRVAVGIDVRGDGGYILVPPSIHPNGGEYRWADGNGPDETEIADAPAWLLDLVTKRPEPQRPFNPSMPQPAADRYVEKAFASELAELSGAPEGARNDSLNRSAFALGQFVGAGVLSRHRAESALVSQAVSLGLPHVEAERTVRSGIEAGMQQPRAIPERQQVNGPARTRETVIPLRAEQPQEASQFLPLLWFGDLQPNLETNDFVEGLLTESAMSIIYGESNCGKTFFTCDLALHIALGRKWFDRDVDLGGVIYAALEGKHGIQNRIAAFRLHHGLDDAILPFAVIPSQINLLDPAADAQRLITAIQQAQERAEQAIRLVVIDTLSRALSGGNENAPDDMGALVMNADRIRQATNAHLCFIHHTGKNQALGARGHSSLRAAVDTEIEIVRDEVTKVATATVTKQRDLETIGTFSFSLTSVELGHNRRGKPVTSCVVTPDDSAAAARPTPHLRNTDKLAITELGELISRAGMENTIPEQGMRPVTAVTRDQVRDWFVKRGLIDVAERGSLSATERSKLHRMLISLKEKGVIGIYGDWIWRIT